MTTFQLDEAQFDALIIFLMVIGVTLGIILAKVTELLNYFKKGKASL